MAKDTGSGAGGSNGTALRVFMWAFGLLSALMLGLLGVVDARIDSLRRSTNERVSEIWKSVSKKYETDKAEAVHEKLHEEIDRVDLKHPYDWQKELYRDFDSRLDALEKSQ